MCAVITLPRCGTVRLASTLVYLFNSDTSAHPSLPSPFCCLPLENAGFGYAFTSSAFRGHTAANTIAAGRRRGKSPTAVRMASSFNPTEVRRNSPRQFLLQVGCCCVRWCKPCPAKGSASLKVFLAAADDVIVYESWVDRVTDLEFVVGKVLYLLLLFAAPFLEKRAQQ